MLRRASRSWSCRRSANRAPGMRPPPRPRREPHQRDRVRSRAGSLSAEPARICTRSQHQAESGTRRRPCLMISAAAPITTRARANANPVPIVAADQSTLVFPVTVRVGGVCWVTWPRAGGTTSTVAWPLAGGVLLGAGRVPPLGRLTGVRSHALPPLPSARVECSSQGTRLGAPTRSCLSFWGRRESRLWRGRGGHAPVRRRSPRRNCSTSNGAEPQSTPICSPILRASSSVKLLRADIGASFAGGQGYLRVWCSGLRERRPTLFTIRRLRWRRRRLEHHERYLRRLR